MSGRSGSIALKMSPRLSSALRSANTIRCCWRRAVRYAHFCNSHDLCSQCFLEPHDGKSGTIRFSRELTMVHANQYHPLPEQSRLVQAKACSITIKQLLSRLFRWQRCQSGSEILALEIQPSKSCASQSISSVCFLFPLRGCFTLKC